MGFFDSIFSGSPATSSKNSTSTITPNVPDWLKQAYQTNTQSGIDYGNSISGLTSDQLIAPFSQDEQNAFNLTRQSTGQYQPVFNSTISTLLGLGQQAANGPSSDQISSLMNPYVQNVLNSQRTAAVQAADQERNQQNQNLQQAGAFGGSRQAVANRELNQGLNQQLDSIQANGMYNAFQSAMGQYNTGLGQQMSAAQGANQGAIQGQASNLQDIQALQSVGTNERSMKQSQLTTDYQQPMVATNYIQQLLNSVPQSMYGATTTGNETDTSTPASGSLFGSLMGAGLGVASLGLPGGGSIGGSLFSSLMGGGAGAGAGAAALGGGAAAAGAGAWGGGGLAALAPLLMLEKGGLVQKFADGGLVGNLGPSSTVDSTSTTATNPLAGSAKIGGGSRSLIDLLLGTNAPNAEGNGLATIKAIRDMEAQDPASLYGQGSTATPTQEGNLENMMQANPGTDNPDWQKALDFISSMGSGSGNSPDNQIDPTELAADAPAAGPAADASTIDNSSPLSSVMATAGSPNSTPATTATAKEDPLEAIMKNTNIPLLAMGLTMMGTPGNFGSQLSAGGLKAAGVMLSEQQAAAKNAQSKEEDDTKKLQLAIDLAKAKALDGYRQQMLASTLADKVEGRDLQKQGLELRRQALNIKQKTKPPTQKDALNLAQRDPRYLMATSKAQKGDKTDLDALQKEYYDRLSAQYSTQQNAADMVINSPGESAGAAPTVMFNDIGKDSE